MEGTTMTQRKRLTAAAMFLAVLASGEFTIAAERETPKYTNLKVLPKDISRDALGQIMLDNLSGLGLPRRAGEGCLFCHAGSLDVPRNEWDYASDEKPMKQKARVMMAMVQEINQTHLAALSARSNPAVEVSCYTCHAARTNPTPLPELLIQKYDSGGVEALTQSYEDLRQRYFARDSYDFRVSTLLDVAERLVQKNESEAAASVLKLNIEHYDNPRAHGGLIQLRLMAALETGGIDGMVERYQSLKQEHPKEAFGTPMLGSLGWGLFRGGQKPAGFRLFELGYAEFPADYFSVENLAWGCEGMGDHDRAIELAENWLAANPDHELGKRLLSELRQKEDP
jgi:hypothetical protein